MLRNIQVSLLLWILLVVGRVQGTVLSTTSRWIVGDDGDRVKFRCVNWAGAQETRIPEGLQWQHVDTIASWIAQQGFNCVRLTYSIDMALDQNQAVSSSFVFAASNASTGAGTALYPDLFDTAVKANPWLSDATTWGAFEQVIMALDKVGLMVILDNHVSHASWCCDLTDGNGWWASASGYFAPNSRYFITDEWISGLEAVAHAASSFSNVVGMSIRNEPRQIPLLQDGDDNSDWYHLMQQGASAIHAAHPDLLVVFAGISSATDLSFLRSNPIDFTALGLATKAVYEFHTYSWDSILTWDCGAWNLQIGYDAGYLLTQGQTFTGPLWVSEFGWAQDDTSSEESQYRGCLISYMQSNDADWAVWAVQGSYYVRNGDVNYDEPYGLLNTDWTNWRNSSWIASVGTMLQITQGPGA